MSVPKFFEFFPTVLTSLKDGNEHDRKEVYGFCAESFSLSRQDMEETIPSGMSRFQNNVSWALSYLKMAGLIQSMKKSRYVITLSGRSSLENGEDVLSLHSVNRLIQERRKAEGREAGKAVFRPRPVSLIRENQDSDEKLYNPKEAIETALLELRRELAEDLLSEVLKMDDYDFEKLVVDLLIRMGYGKPEQNTGAVTQRTADEGIDGIVRADRFGFDAIYAQAKKWKEEASVGRPEIQKFLGAMVGQGAVKGLFITTASFTKEAIEFSKKQIGHKVVLVDGRQLAELMIEYGLAVTTVETLKIQRIDTDYFNGDD